MKTKYDCKSDAAYIYIKNPEKSQVDHTIEINNNVLLDVDSKGSPVGIEILNASKTLQGEKIISNINV